ncbi:TetR/AcrR family transcriptional regulator [Nocardia brasiliensis]|uniref:TetR/AcrR family transcriptional regulator n=1 Tax=Nocardia brasiliensis TaxID=37326 RepID=UPI0036710631
MTSKGTINAQATNRRDRVRQATMGEIRDTARRLLLENGAQAVTINAIAREMGMSGPALYRYYPRHEVLVQAITADFYDELTAAVAAARDTHSGAGESVRLLAMCRAMRAWAVAHPAEFGWLFATPSTTLAPDSLSYQSALGFEAVFRNEVAALWLRRPFAVPDLAALDPSLREQLTTYSRGIDGQLPPEAAHVFLKSWIRLYGLLCMEVLRQLDFAFSDLTPVFEEFLREFSADLGLDYTPEER